MQVDKLWMEHWFAIFNKEYFDGELPLPRLALSRSRTRLGSMACKRVKRLFKSEKFTDFAIRLSNFYDLSEREFQNVLLHEMIHLKIAFLGMKDTAPHGVVFRRMADELNRSYGWNIRVTGSTRGVKPAQPQPSRDYLVLALLLDSGEYLFSVVNPR
ncbi:MAG: SprT-like domain-containing protein, partial [Prevotella salivae]|nr:SprT-like domain-containing protein [Segatella salivae]